MNEYQGKILNIMILRTLFKKEENTANIFYL